MKMPIMVMMTKAIIGDTSSSMAAGMQIRKSFKETSLKPNLLIKKAFHVFQHQLALMVLSKFVEKLIYCKFANKPNVLGFSTPCISSIATLLYGCVALTALYHCSKGNTGVSMDALIKVNILMFLFKASFSFMMISNK